jgi:hypothetical protein
MLLSGRNAAGFRVAMAYRHDQKDQRNCRAVKLTKLLALLGEKKSFMGAAERHGFTWKV